MDILILWLLAAGPLWAVVGARILPRRYRSRGLDPRQAALAGGLWGSLLGPAVLAYLFVTTPVLRQSRHVWTPALLLTAELMLLFRALYPTNPLVTDPGYLANQLQDGLIVGAVYATMAVGLTLIYSVQGIISFTHGQIVMFGGVLGYLLLTKFLAVNALFVIPLVGLVALALGLLLERTLLLPLHAGSIERPGEYAILITFGFGLFLQYALVGVLGNPSGIRAPRYTDRPLLGLSASTLDFGALRVRTDLLIAAAIGLALFVLLTWFLQRTWTGRSLRAVAMNRQAAAVAGIDSGRAFTLAFGIGTMLAGMSGAALVAVMNFPVPEVATVAAIRSYVVIVLGGLGSVPGAFLGGLLLGVAEALTVAGFPDPSRGATYQVAAGLVLFGFILLVRPQGFLGRRE